ncbi:hypothetical protein P153DRAFT_362309 [Dothidotthia symphoricarpi CBS 119687]|uniref:RED-like N-terminal domain-containing protein n=1 Tax=Dothidotthia symphoricarpi CBS 119687 TaxID=1392245 RepID=A0A6A6AVJ6_9PLEO|nr:uncharacterized protein P153DRAFT_362309 [Dothidotthia symphoricarpi CBS 119687]KAF2134551.1 hypothetical protein P153DRAFT_362309 [Dothidotthia symphoricarpi CBS 119687]
MNNQQFRRLLLSDTQKQQDDGTPKPSSSRTPGTVLGARKHSSIPMTPRQVGRGSIQSDFARQLAERNAKANPQRKARASAPKGTKLAEGYTDRTKERVDPEDNEIAKRIKNLEDAMKLGQIDRETFENLVQEITGGEVETTHLVKGLDRKLLERVRRGEDVLGSEEKVEEEEPGSEVEDAFDELADEDVGPVVREKAEKKGERMTTPPPVAGVKRSRNDILKDLKRQREEAARLAAEEHEKKYPTLGSGFRKVTAKETSRVEVDNRGREILIITGPDGKEKRKVKKQKVDDQPALEVRHDLDDVAKPINMHNLPEPKKEESEEEDIFEGVGSNYNPLANFDDEDDDSEEEAEAKVPATEPKAAADEDLSEGEASESGEDVPEASTSTLPKPSVSAKPAKRDYFKSTTASTSATTEPSLSSADATVRAALAKVRNLDENSTLLQNLSGADPSSAESKEARLKKRAAELAATDRDMEDMDLGFGASRFDDADEMEREGEKVKFSEWKGLGAGGDEDDEDGEKKKAEKRKRGPKKKRGDKNNPEDVLKAMERLKEKKPKTLG